MSSRQATRRVRVAAPVLGLLFLAFWPPGFVGAQESTPVQASFSAQSLLPVHQISLGGRDGWDEAAVLENVQTVSGWRGGDDVVLRERFAAASDTADMLIPFDTDFLDVAGRYVLTANGRITTTITRFGAGAAAFTGGPGIEVQARSGALFNGDRTVGELSIEFWFYPVEIDEGSSILAWRGVVTEQTSTAVQRIVAEIDNNRLRWRLENVARIPDGGFESVELSSQRALIPRRWQHHRLTYDPVTTRISYDIDGVPVDVSYLTDTRRQSGDRRSFFLGTPVRGGLEIGAGLTGAIDELRVYEGSVAEYEQTQFSGDPGVLITQPIDLGSISSEIQSIVVRVEKPGGTDVRGYYRLADRPTAHDARQALGSDWNAIPSDGVIAGRAVGRFLQLRFELLADAPRQESPRLQSVDIRYVSSPPPPPPQVLMGEPVPGGVNLRWNEVRTGNIGGYRIFFGEEPGRYTGVLDLVSPLDVGNATEWSIEGLEPNVPYVFALQSYDQQGQTGPISHEIEVRGGR